MTTENDDRPRAPGPADTTDVATLPLRDDKGSLLTTAAVYAGRPCRGRCRTVLIVECPVCGEVHVHRADDAQDLHAGKLVKHCPVRGRMYRLWPVRRPRGHRLAPAQGGAA